MCNSDESSALLQFKNSFLVNLSLDGFLSSSFSPNNTESWAKDEDCCTWSGVTCERVTGHVSGLDLSFGGLQGILHPNSSLFSLGHLKMLDLSFNDFMGSSISSMFGGFVSMTHLHLADSNFTGQIPPEISHLSKLVSLKLSSGLLSFDPYERTTIDTLSMRRIAQNLTSLRVLSLYIVDMSLVESDSFLNFSSSLTSLSLSNCNLRGKFPLTIFHLPNLEELDLSGNNNLTGYTPKSNWSSPLNDLRLSETKISIDLLFLTSSLKSLRVLFLQQCSFSRPHLELSGNLTQLMSLILSGNSFGGQIPWSLLNSEQLISLDLSSNMFVGELPEIHSNFSKASSYVPHPSKEQLVGSIPMGLTILGLSYNLLGGIIPSWVYSLPSLDSLTLSHNEFIGNIHDFQSPSWRNLDLSNNKLHGLIPSSIYGLVQLSNLDISSNNLSGVVKFEKFKTLQSLTYLDLSYNHLMVSFQNFSNYALPNLSTLHMSSCNITQFPYFLINSTQLTSLDLSNNQIQGNFPAWVLEVGRNSISYVNLSHNFLTGSIEQFLWKNIQFLDLRSNLFRGKLPIPSPSTYFFSMSNNQLTGRLPSTICNLTSVKVIDLSNNSLSGRIPECIGNLSPKLSVLDLHMNQFRGKIPSTFPKDNFLRNLNLHGNQMEGTLPQSLLNCKMLEVLDLGDNNINDTFPKWLESLPELQVLILRSNRLYGPIGNPETKFPFQKLRIIDLSSNQFGGPLPAKYF
ncbi:receptor-like protein 6 [Argentina anserina]|uniref:receptor-like protein 6 n=1 Tax=Argentina anserina TaxID=57926 RepID=UPI0021762DC8|nr:receptor-like protein 6 [Potentilla anserina]